MLKWISENEIKFLKLLFIFGLLLKLGFIFYWNSNHNFKTFEHGMIAENIAEGNGFAMYWPYAPASEEKIALYKSVPKVKSAFIPPLNPFLLSLFYTLFGVCNLANMFYLSILAIISAATPILVYRTSKLLFNDRIAVFSTIIYFFFLPAIYSVITFSGGVIYHFLAIAIIYYFSKIIKFNLLRDYVFVGALLALQTLTRSEFLLLSLLMLFISFLINRNRAKELRNTLLAFSVFVVLVSPWVIRNTILFEKLVPIVSHPWHEIWRGSNEYSTGGSFAKGERPNWMGIERFPKIHSALDSIEYNQQFELKADSVFKHNTISFWKKEPNRSIFLSIKRVLILWSYDPHTLYSSSLAYVIPSILISLLFFISLFILKKIRLFDLKPLLFIFSFVIYYTLLIAIVNFEVRYQVYLQSTIILIEGLVLEFLYRKLNINFRKSAEIK